MTLLQDSDGAERMWVLVHSNLGPYLVCAWYRPPVQGEVDSIRTYRDECVALKTEAVGTVMIGDIKIHHKKWLRRSNRNSAEGVLLHNFCGETGMQQLVHEATRGDYLLDLAITDVEDAKVKVLPKIADHNCLLIHFELPVPESDVTKRQVWRFRDADWERLKKELATTHWEVLKLMDVDGAADDGADNPEEFPTFLVEKPYFGTQSIRIHSRTRSSRCIGFTTDYVDHSFF